MKMVHRGFVCFSVFKCVSARIYAQLLRSTKVWFGPLRSAVTVEKGNVMSCRFCAVLCRATWAQMLVFGFQMHHPVQTAT